MDTSELVSDKSPLENPPDISALDCPGSPSLNHSDSFGLLADDSQPDTSLFGSANLPPVLVQSVLQGEQGLLISEGIDLGASSQLFYYFKFSEGQKSLQA